LENAIDSELVGQVLGETYKVERLIGQGGMGAIYEASHVRLPRKFAIKMLNAEALANEELYQRFRREAEIASSIGHDNITQVLDFNQTPDGTPFMVLELLVGEDLQGRLKRVGKLTLAETAQLLVQVASGLEAAHEQGVVHRDLKPPNLFICKRAHGADRIKILDFGISKLTSSNSVATKTGSVMGTPHYMAPEQADGRAGAIDARSDIFALGCILFRCLTGQLPFVGPTLMGTMYQIVHGPPKSIAALAPELPQGVVDAVNHALCKDQAGRPQSATLLCQEFLLACPEDILESTQTGMPTPMPMPMSTLSLTPVAGQGRPQTPVSSTQFGGPRAASSAPTVASPDHLATPISTPSSNKNLLVVLGAALGVLVIAAAAFLGGTSGEPSQTPAQPETPAAQGAGAVEAPEPATPEEVVPVEVVPEEATPEEAVPEEAVPEGGADSQDSPLATVDVDAGVKADPTATKRRPRDRKRRSGGKTKVPKEDKDEYDPLKGR
jgi:serine/threonine-protein kinase